ncbi:MAG TPA: response regulator transcription factor [Chloroflexota bacterium]|nr:response regulator transcription factor [Chloroflexota bacterium]
MKSALVFATSAVVRAGLISIVEQFGVFAVQGSAATRTELLEEVDESPPDVILADLGAGDSDLSTELLSELRPVVMLTDDLLPASVGRETGVSLAVLPRDAGDEQIIAAMMAVSAGLVVMHPSQEVPAPVRSTGREDAPQTEALTARETEVLGMIAEGLANKAIARRLGISDHTVKFHVGSILGKLDAESRTEAVTLGVRQGLITV